MIRFLRSQGATTRPAIADACRALRSMLAGGPHPFADPDDVAFFRAHPVLHSHMYEVDDPLVPFVGLGVRLERAVAWHVHDTRAAYHLQQLLQAVRITDADGKTFRLPAPALQRVDVFLFGEQVDFELGSEWNLV